MALGVTTLNSDGSLAVNTHPTQPPRAPVWGADQCLVDEEWAKFRSYLAERPGDVARLVLSIAEVERIIGRRLPDEAALPQWWSTCPRLEESEDGKRWHMDGMPGHYLVEFARS